MEKVVIVDYGMSNLHSVFSALKEVSSADFAIHISQEINDIENADRIVFPGQGAAADCMQHINSLGLGQTIIKAAKEKPFLGICMGMQVLLEHSDENGGTTCLGLLKGSVNAFAQAYEEIGVKGHKIPHMGWNTIEQTLDHPLWANIDQNSYFYFVHSYFVNLDDPKHIAGKTDYGIEFSSVLADGKVFAMQCHPEKSADNGLQLLKNFLHWKAND